MVTSHMRSDITKMSDPEKQVPAGIHGDSVENLDDDKMNQSPDFKGATLELNSQGTVNQEPTVAFQGPGMGLDRNLRPGSSISRKTTGSTGSKTTLSSQTIVTPIAARSYFCQRVRTNRNNIIENYNKNQ